MTCSAPASASPPPSGIDDWARADATPSGEEITRIRRLIDQINGDIAGLGADERAAIDQAVTVIRKHRAVSLGMPAARPPAPAQETTHMTSTAAPHARPTAAMTKGRQADSARRRQRVITALDKAAAAGTEISVSGIARAAGVDRTFLYRHRDLLGKIHALEAAPPATGASRRAGRHPGLAASRPARRPRTRPPAHRPHPANSKSACPRRSASKPGTNPGSARPPTSTPSTRRSPTSSSRPSTCASSSKNATRTSPPPARPTASSWPSSTTRPGAPDPPSTLTCTTPVTQTVTADRPLTCPNPKTARHVRIIRRRTSRCRQS